MENTIFIDVGENGVRRVSLLATSETDETRLFGIFQKIRWVLCLLNCEILDVSEAVGKDAVERLVGEITRGLRDK